MTASTGTGAVVPPWTLTDRLRKAREWGGFVRQSDLANATGISTRSISNYEQAKSKPKWMVIREWALACGVSEDWLGGDDVPRPPASRRPRQDSNLQPVAYYGTVSHLTVVGPSTPELVAA